MHFQIHDFSNRAPAAALPTRNQERAAGSPVRLRTARSPGPTGRWDARPPRTAQPPTNGRAARACFPRATNQRSLPPAARPMGRALSGRLSHSNCEQRSLGAAFRPRSGLGECGRAGPGKTARVQGPGRGAAEWGKVGEETSGGAGAGPRWARGDAGPGPSAVPGLRLRWTSGPEGEETWLCLLASRSLFMPHCLAYSAAVQPLV